MKIETFDRRQCDTVRDSSTFSSPLSTVCEIMRLNNFVVLELALNPASQRRVWKKKRFANQIHPLDIFPPLQVHFQTCCHLSTITSDLHMNGSLFFLFILLFPKLTWNDNIWPGVAATAAAAGLWADPLLQSGAKCLACGLLGSIFKQVWREAFHDGCRQTWAELQTLHTTRCLLSCDAMQHLSHY